MPTGQPSPGCCSAVPCSERCLLLITLAIRCARLGYGGGGQGDSPPGGVRSGRHHLLPLPRHRRRLFWGRKKPTRFAGSHCTTLATSSSASQRRGAVSAAYHTAAPSSHQSREMEVSTYQCNALT